MNDGEAKKPLKNPAHSSAGNRLNDYEKMISEKSSPERGQIEFAKLRKILADTQTKRKPTSGE